MNPATAKRDVKTMYAAIVNQAISDMNNPEMYQEIYEFFVSNHGKGMLEVLGIDFRIIDEKFQVTEKAKLYRQFMKAYNIGLNDIELARHLKWEYRQVVYWRKKFNLPEHTGK